ncbi:hypothetical protein BO94DRAFT_535171 [Aspergillus sclerotioniger CBS 115572]|uniref:18S rRNA factor 2 n=1 Tax=Aspergillus sclerotioniger CBS 115572 TaxID=1450535 RepID=A0A317WKP1_9EURO|nr:hypothetical protein BO94DRAFT_535171 [Aspergillus sclerotioniger CBS 115572]PWY87054.1 hypothetical protein BO94DRAFT_535171 [Aspergillus sclerotioniger CBS 115572]
MTTRKRNEFLDIVASDDSDANDHGYDSEAAEAEKSKGRAVKRRRTQPEPQSQTDLHGLNSDSDDGGASDESEDERVFKGRGKAKAKAKKTAADDDTNDSEDEATNHPDEDDNYLDATPAAPPKQSTRANRPRRTKQPFALKALLEKRSFGPITRVFLSPEVRSASAPRKRLNKRKTYSDGWVEFASKKTAKVCAETLNANIIGGRKGGWYHDDVWNMKYLRGFKWADLTEQIQRERSEREARQRVEDSKARKEDKVFLEGYERGKVIEGIQKKNAEKGKKSGKEEQKVRMVFKQSEVKQGRDKIADPGQMGDETKRVLGKIF